MKNRIRPAQLTNAPAAHSYCKHCKRKQPFICSGRFRVNAQKKSLDVWLIYKCLICGATWNLTVLSRVNPRAIPLELLQGFQDNDPELAARYALGKKQ